MIAARTRALLSTALVIVGFTLKAPLASRHIHLTPDAVFYLSVARSLASGHGYLSTIKLHYIDNTGVIHGAVPDCPPLYPIVEAGILRCGGNVVTLVLLNTLLACLASGLVFLIGEKLFDWRTGLTAGSAAALAPNLFHSGITPMSDPLALVLALGSLLLVLGAERRMTRWLAAGVLAGLAILTRYPTAVVGIAIVAFALAGKKGRSQRLACVIGIVPAVSFVVLIPSVQRLHYSVESFRAAMWSLGTPVDPLYCLHHPGLVSTAFLRDGLFYSVDLLTGLRGLFLLSLGLALWLFRARTKALKREQKLVLWVATISVGVYAATWSIPPVKGSRFLLLPHCLLLPFCAAGLLYTWDKWNRMGKAAVAGACAATAIVYVLGCTSAASYTGGDVEPLPRATAKLITAALPPRTAVASNNPWVIGYSTGLPTALLPRNLDQQSLRRFVRRYRIGVVVLLGKGEGSETARAVSFCYRIAATGRGITAHTTTARRRTKAD